MPFTFGRDQPYDEAPPPYTESGETTQPASLDVPGAVEDMMEEQWRLREIRNKSKPFYQFRSQAKREEKRLHDQRIGELRGRRPTLPFDEATDYKANAENNVRARWVEQGIWGEEWGPAWRQGIRPLGIAGMTVPSCDGPFYSLATPHRRPGGSRWGHEQGNTPSPSPPPSPPRPRIPDALISVPRSRSRSPSPPPAPKQPRPRYQIARVLPDGSIIAKVPKPIVRDSEASRPLPQFLYQVAKEREWIKDETAYKTPGRAVDLDSLAYQSVKENWIKDGIWSPKWDGELPGPSWYHEEPESWGPVEPRQSPRHTTTTRPDHQDGTAPSNTQARQTRPKRSRSDDTAESEQPAPPLKRAKKSGGGKGRASTANDGPAETTSDPRENLPAGRKMGAQGARTMESESNGDSQKGGTRRSTRIVNRQAQAEAAATDVTNITPAAPASSRVRAARKGKTTSSDTQVVMAPKGGKKRRHRRRYQIVLARV